jgi:RNase H-fold protein (predicted Holliday junction resolvase)
LGDATYTVDPASLLGKEVETFELGASATGTVLAVDETAVQQVAEANIGPQVQEGYQLVEGSSDIEPSPGVVENGVITFPVTITARQVLQVDPAAVEAQIRGKSLKDAKAILDTYGQSELSVWPDWVGTIPTLDQRVDVPDGGAGGAVTAYLGIDLGDRRIGVAIADGPDVGARPLVTLKRGRPSKTTCPAAAAHRGQCHHRSRRRPAARGGWRRGTAGDPDPRLGRGARSRLGARVAITLRDERLSSHLAESRLGPMRRGRSGGPPSKAQRDAYRERVDREAAAIILQDELDSRRATGLPQPRTTMETTR